MHQTCGVSLEALENPLILTKERGRLKPYTGETFPSWPGQQQLNGCLTPLCLLPPPFSHILVARNITCRGFWINKSNKLGDLRVERSGNRSGFSGGYSYSVSAGVVLVSKLAAGLGVFVWVVLVISCRILKASLWSKKFRSLLS